MSGQELTSGQESMSGQELTSGQESIVSDRPSQW
jgi:hypothetical protein